MANTVKDRRHRRTLGIVLLLLLLAFLFGTPAYTGKKNHPPATPGATTQVQYASSGVTFGTHHSGTETRQTGTGWLPAYTGPVDGEGGRLRNLRLLKDVGREDWGPDDWDMDDWHRHGGGDSGGVPGEGSPGGDGYMHGGFGGGGSGGGGGGNPPYTDDRQFLTDTGTPSGPGTKDGGTSNFAPPVDTAISAVPEPESWVLMILGLGAVGVMLRRRVPLRAAPG